MDKDVSHSAEHLLDRLRKLKEVFDVCDEDSDGFILPEHLVRLGSRFGHNEQVSSVTHNGSITVFMCVNYFYCVTHKNAACFRSETPNYA